MPLTRERRVGFVSVSSAGDVSAGMAADDTFTQVLRVEFEKLLHYYGINVDA
jgi:hypothetical protein